MALIRVWRAVQTMGSVRIAGVLAAVALSGSSCGGIASSGGPSKSDAGAQGVPAPGTQPNTGSGMNASGTAPPSSTVVTAPTGSATPPLPGANGSTQPILLGSGAACSPSASTTVGTKVTVSTSWPATAATAKGSGPVLLWLLSTYDIDSSGGITGTTTTCEMQVPPVTFSALGAMARGVPSGQTGTEQFGFPTTSWNGVPPVKVTGTLGGWNVGSSWAVDPVVMLYGLQSTNHLADGSLPWPTGAMAFASGDLTYADGTTYVPGVGQPGITATYVNGNALYPPTTALAPGSPTVAQAFMVLRTQVRLYGTSTSCTQESGQAFVTDLNMGIVGCELTGSQGLCTTDQAGFVNANATPFDPGTGTFTSQQLAAGATCIDVISALP